MEGERRSAAYRRRRPGNRVHGEWWSTPACHGLVASTPSMAVTGGSPARLTLMEDGHVMEEGWAWRVTPPAGARVLELGAAADWADLARTHPLEVSESRRVGWQETFGRPAAPTGADGRG